MKIRDVSIESMIASIIRKQIVAEKTECIRKRKTAVNEVKQLQERLELENDTLTFKEYIEIENRIESLSRWIQETNIEIKTWEKAKAICLAVEGINRR